jgi:hypothetical protein
MLVQTEGDAGPPGRPSGVLDSPILARVERVLLRHEEGLNRDGRFFARPEYTQVRTTESKKGNWEMEWREAAEDLFALQSA